MGSYRIDNRYVTIGGRRQTISAWCREYGITRQLVYWREKRGMPLELAIVKPVRGWRGRVARDGKEAQDGQTDQGIAG